MSEDKRLAEDLQTLQAENVTLRAFKVSVEAKDAMPFSWQEDMQQKEREVASNKPVWMATKRIRMEGGPMEIDPYARQGSTSSR